MRIFKIIGLLLLLILAITFPLLFPNPAVTTIAIFTLIFAAAATGWNIFSGYTGYVSLGHAAYFGLGGYALAIMCQDWKIPGGYIPFLFVPFAGLVAAIFAIPLGWITLRVRRHTFVVITIAIFFILQLCAYNLRGITNGSTGMELPIPIDWSGDFFNFPFYYVALVVLIVTIALTWWVRNSKYGLGLLAVRDDEDRALGLGVRTGPYKLVAFVISALIVGMVGAIWAYFVESIYPPSGFDATFDIAVVLMAYLGGLGTISGPILGALILEPAQQYFTLQYGENGYYLVIYGALFLFIMLLLPRGIIPTLNERWIKFQHIRRIRHSENNPAIAAAASGRDSGEKGESIIT
ncbi:MAG: branched-chain amino acid ABC transporter permease [Ktedonobacteraceae bacterium]|nr:branched-chain amino acid ABC transporter permease [Ktedonobacteraceae bacterium]MBV9711173.1 branched-chain amino acid ABC transporter permease [Ktedonobacteraceae bacterium]